MSTTPTTYRDKITQTACEAIAQSDKVFENIKYLMRFSTLNEDEAQALEELCEDLDRLTLRVKIYAIMMRITGKNHERKDT